MERYVIRIYRRDPADPKKIAGSVECSGGYGRKGFLSSDVLVNILVSSREMPKERAESPDKCEPGDEFKSYSEIMESIRVEMEGQEL